MEREISALSKTYEGSHVGADFRNYWGHSEMELDWDAGRPNEINYMHPVYKGNFMKDSTPEMWMVNDGRDQMFAGILFVWIDDIEEVVSYPASSSVPAYLSVHQVLVGPGCAAYCRARWRHLSQVEDRIRTEGS